MIRWRDLSPDRQEALRSAWGQEMTRQSTTCALVEKIARFAAWLAPQGISFTQDDLPARKRPAPRPPHLG